MQKRLLSVFLALALAFGLVPVSVLASGWDGTSTAEPALEEGFYQIGTAEELAWFRDHVNGGGYTANAALTADIDLNNRSWTPIGGGDGFATTYFGGEFDGGGFAVSGFTVSAAYNHAGFFGYVKGSANIHQLQIEAAVITSSSSNVGGIAGTIVDGRIDSCSFSGTVTNSKASNGYAGGIAGYMGSTSATAPSIQGCANYGTVSGPYAGGITAYAKYSSGIADCYNTGAVTGATRAGGIVGQLMNGTPMARCYSTGEISGAAGGLAGWNGVSISSCYWLQPEAGAAGGAGSLADSALISSPEGLLELLNAGGSLWAADENNLNNGYPILAWQAGSITPPDTAPSVSLAGAKPIFAQEGAGDSFATLNVTLKHIDSADVEAVNWSIEKKDGGSAASVAALTQVENDPYSRIVTPLSGGVATVTASVTANGETYSASADITVIPHITTARIVSAEAHGAVAVGQTVTAAVFVAGGGEYDYDNYPPLTYQWKYRPGGGTIANIPGATGSAFTIPAEYAEWDYLHLEVYCGGQTVVSAMDVYESIRSADYGRLYPVAYDEAFTLPSVKKDAGALVLPSYHTVGGVTAGIEWTASSDSAIIGTDGRVTLPQSGRETVTLTARFTYGAAFAIRSFNVTVWSQADTEAEAEGKNAYLQAAAEALGSFYGLTPVFGTDSNVTAMLSADLAAEGYGDISVSIKSASQVYGDCAIAPNGDITYFYADPNGTRGVWFGRYDVTFVLSHDGAELELPKVPVTLHWNGDQVRQAMGEQILDGVTETAILGGNPSLDNVTSDLVLPKTAEGKRWTLISWTSSDPGAVFISRENQGTADTLFDPYVGKVIRGEGDKTVTLTAAFTFQRTANEPAIVMYKAFTVTVKALSGGEAEAVRAGLLSKLDKGFASKGLRDYVTGAALDKSGEKYIAAGDIQLPATRDFGVDGKYYPVTITVSDGELMSAPDVANAARVSVYRPLPGQPAEMATVTVTITDKAKGISASREFLIEVQPLTQEEIDSALSLMELAREGYFDGLSKGRYADAFSVTGGLTSFNEAVWNEGKTAVRWVYSSSDAAGNGIITDELPNWADQEAWRAFRSSNPKVLGHETLNLAARPNEDTFVNLNSVLTHEVLGKYWARFGGTEGYESFEALYKQPVSVCVMVAGKTHRELPQETLMGMRAAALAEITAPISVSFTLKGAEGALFTQTLSGLDAGATVFEVFRQALLENGYSYSSNGSYVRAITDPNGGTLAEMDSGKNSGWIYRVNDSLPGVYMNGFSLEDGDSIVVLFTKDYTKEEGYKPDNSGNSGSSSGTPADGTPSGTAPLDPKPAADISFADVSQDDWFYADVQFVYAKGLMSGTGEGAFAPASPTTRAMLVTVLNRLSEKQYDKYEIEVARLHSFSDIPQGQWYSYAVSWAGGAGIINGMGDNSFAPLLSVTRQDLAVILYRYAKAAGVELPQLREAPAFADGGQIADYAQEAVTALFEAGVINGKDGNLFDPAGSATRAEVAAMLHRFIEATEK